MNAVTGVVQLLQDRDTVEADFVCGIPDSVSDML